MCKFQTSLRNILIIILIENVHSIYTCRRVMIGRYMMYALGFLFNFKSCCARKVQLHNINVKVRNKMAIKTKVFQYTNNLLQGFNIYFAVRHVKICRRHIQYLNKFVVCIEKVHGGIGCTKRPKLVKDLL